MSIQFECESCFTQYNVGDDKAGRSFRCKQCGSAVRVPDDDDFAEPAELQAPRMRRRGNSGQGRRAPDSSPVKWIVLGGVGIVLLFVAGFGIFSLLLGEDQEPDPEVAQAEQRRPLDVAEPPPAMVKRPPKPKGRRGHRLRPQPKQPGAAPEPLAAQTDESPFEGAKQAAPTLWDVVVDAPAPATEPPAFRDIEIPVGNSRPKSVVVSNSADTLVIPGFRSYEFWDLRSNKQLGALRDDLSSVFKGAISPEGKYYTGIASRSKAIVLYDIPGQKRLGEITLPKGSGRRISGRRGGGNVPPDLAFAGRDRLIAVERTAGDKPNVYLWSLPSGTPERSFVLENRVDSGTIALSPAGRYLAYFVSQIREKTFKLHVVDLETGEVAGEIPLSRYMPKSGISRCEGLAFSPDGTELAGIVGGLSEQRLLCWNVADGSMLGEFPIDKEQMNKWSRAKSGNRCLQWFPDKQRWLVYGHSIFDRSAGTVVWSMPESDDLDAGGRYVLDDRRVTVFKSMGIGKQKIESYELPAEKIAQSAQAVATGGLTEDGGLPPLTAADSSRARTISLNTTATNWSVTADPAAAPTAAEWKQPIPIQPGRGTADSFLIARGAGTALVGYDGGSKVRPKVQLDVYDVKAGQHQKSVEIPFSSRLLALSPSGTQALLRTGSNEDRLDVWSLDDAAPAVAWRPYQKDEEHERTVIGAAFVDDSHVLTLSSGDRLVLWELPACRAVYAIDHVSYTDEPKGYEAIQRNYEEAMDRADAEFQESMRNSQQRIRAAFNRGKNAPGDSQPDEMLKSRRKQANTGLPNISPSGKMIAIVTNDRCVFLDSLSGSILGSINIGGRQSAAAFHPDRTRFGVVVDRPGGGLLAVIDLKTGQVSQEIPLPVTATTIQWCAGDTLLIDGELLVDLERERIGWKYLAKNVERTSVPSDLRTFLLFDKSAQTSQGLITAKELPGPSVADKLAADSSLPPKILQPGMSVSLKINVNGTPGATQFSEDLRNKLREDFEQAGITVSSGQPVTLFADVTLRKTGEFMTFQKLAVGRNGARKAPATRIPITLLNCRFTMKHGGREVWVNQQEFGNHKFGLVQLKQGETAADIAAQAQWERASQYCLNLELPVHLFDDDAKEGLGQSVFAP